MYRLSQKHDYKCHFVCKSTILSIDDVRKVLAKDNVDKSKMMYQGQNVLRDTGVFRIVKRQQRCPQMMTLGGGTRLMIGLKKTD